jgi:hypothetical protein
MSSGQKRTVNDARVTEIERNVRGFLLGITTLAIARRSGRCPEVHLHFPPLIPVAFFSHAPIASAFCGGVKIVAMPGDEAVSRAQNATETVQWFSIL